MVHARHHICLAVETASTTTCTAAGCVAAVSNFLDVLGLTTAPLQVLTCVRMVSDLLRSEDPGFKMSPKPNVTSRFLVLPEMIGPAIIGKSGTHAKHIKDRTGVRIEVVRKYQLGALHGQCAHSFAAAPQCGVPHHTSNSTALASCSGWVCVG